MLLPSRRLAKRECVSEELVTVSDVKCMPILDDVHKAIGCPCFQWATASSWKKTMV